ncbi:MAG: response regulator transcription factor, partial [Methyloprofundus sp.]|nr:response regulator transcription factor [Methyloprofundus sp.]
MQLKNKKTIRVLIAEDHEVVRHGLRSIMDQEHDLTVIGEAASCKEILMLASTLNPCVILLNVTLNDGESLGCIARLKEHCPNCKILLFTASKDKETHLLALRYGVVGIVLKSETAELLCKAIRNVHLHNIIWVDKALMAEMWQQNTQETKNISTTSTDKENSPDSSLPLNTLTPRESQIACLSSKGLTAKKIGAKLFISEKTVRNQLTVIYSKLGVKNQLELSTEVSQLL